MRTCAQHGMCAVAPRLERATTARVKTINATLQEAAR
jgi:hypothetical protein